jgi:hypothetical protein
MPVKTNKTFPKNTLNFGETIQGTQQSMSKSMSNSGIVNADNTFSVLTKRHNLDILCIKAINAYAKYDIN